MPDIEKLDLFCTENSYPPGKDEIKGQADQNKFQFTPGGEVIVQADFEGILKDVFMDGPENYAVQKRVNQQGLSYVLPNNKVRQEAFNKIKQNFPELLMKDVKYPEMTKEESTTLQQAPINDKNVSLARVYEKLKEANKISKKFEKQVDQLHDLLMRFEALE